MCSTLLRTAKIPPCTFGCKVLTRPSIISGKSVKSSIVRTAIPESCRRLAVPPVETISIPCSTNSRQNSSMPVLLETLTKARLIMGLL
ncbi:MAG: hypothetical protein ACD_43C00012G0001 [uncultured bacterium]|nr:MAG: hypothetical protein ACD_43C00012G0001 [uncultured bacterium]